jgi:hypothetical protein
MVRNRFGRERALALIWARRSPYSARSPPERDSERAVSQESVETLRRALDALNRRDNGKVVRSAWFRKRAEALEAAGLEE